MKINSIILLLLLLSSCCGLHTEVKYKSGDALVTRIDECGRTTFYYGSGQSESSGRIWTEYSGINDGFFGYLMFGENGKVTLLAGDGYFQSEGLNKSLFKLDTTFFYESPKGKSVYEILLSTRYEQERNKGSNSKIRAEYNIDENEWW